MDGTYAVFLINKIQTDGIGTITSKEYLGKYMGFILATDGVRILCLNDVGVVTHASYTDVRIMKQEPKEVQNAAAGLGRSSPAGNK